MATICVDFDKTIHDQDHPMPGHRMGPPMPGAVEGMKKLNMQGHTLIVFTARATGHAERKAVEDWLHHFGVPYKMVTNIKPIHAVLYIDDRGYRFHNWDQTLRDVPSLLRG